MDRIEIIQKILDKKKGKTYLEVGVAAGDAFLSINAEKKLGIDPIPPVEEICRVIDNKKVSYFEMTSDDFFDYYSNIPNKSKIDIAFIDALHTYKQSLKDVENCLKFLNMNGAIILHDCNPPNEVIGLPASTFQEARLFALEKGLLWDGNWCGDVWKTIVYLRSQRKDLNAFVLDTDYGVGVVTRGKPEKMLDFSVEDIEQMTYLDLAEDKEKMLNLKHVKYIDEYIRSSLK